MDKIRAIIIDDERHCIETLHWQLEQYCPEVELVGECNSAEAGLQNIKEKKPDLIFLDIEMPRMNGFDMLESMEKIDFDIIFTTAYDQFAVKAFKVSAVDYLLKPIDKEELKHAIQKVTARKREPVNYDRLNLLFEQLNHSLVQKKIAVPTMEGLEFIETDNIIHCKSESNYTNIFLLSGKSILISKTLKEVEEMLSGSNFYRIHHSHIINLNHIKKYVRGDGGYVVLINDEVINVSRSRKEGLLKLFS